VGDRDYELRHPATKRGSAGGRAKAAKAKGAKSQNETEQADAFIDDTAKKTGKGRSTIARRPLAPRSLCYRRSSAPRSTRAQRSTR
jgi:hypothetical protein